MEKKARTTITIDAKILKKFEEKCEKMGMKVSSRIEVLIKEDI